MLLSLHFAGIDVPRVYAACPTFPTIVPAGDTARLIEVIGCANATVANDVINLTSSTYTLTTVNASETGLPPIVTTVTGGTLTINGNGATITRSAAGGTPSFRFFHVDAGGNLTLNKLVLSNGSASYGGAVYNLGTLNTRKTTFLLNAASLDGGALYSESGTAVVNESSFTNNSGNYGGGLFSRFSTTTVNGSTFYSNFAVFDGGGIYSEDGTLTIRNSTLYSNNASYGGGLMSRRNDTMIGSTTFVSNFAFDAGGGIYNEAGTVTLTNSLLASNSPTDFTGTITSQGYNLITNTSGATITGLATGNLLDGAASPLNFGGFGINGGTTGIVPLLPGSVAINAGDPSYTAPPERDQRGSGFPRVRAGRIDIGAYERLICPTFPASIADGDEDALIAAIDCANLTPANDIINLAAGGTYTLTTVNNDDATDVFNFPVGNTGLPITAITATGGTLTINGNGAIILRDANAPDFRFFYVDDSSNLTLNDVALLDGRAEFFGGAIVNDGTLTLNGISATGNATTDTNINNVVGGTAGGAIHNYGILTINDSSFEGNSSTFFGGAITRSTGSVIINRTRFSGNSASTGGAIMNFGFTMSSDLFTITDSTIMSNTASEDGGGIYLRSGTLTITSSTIVANVANRDGGGISVDSVILNLNNVTLSGNAAIDDGGGIFINAGAVNLNNSTLVGNSAATTGGGVSINGFPYLTRAANTLIAANTAPIGPDIYGVMDLNGYNVISNSSGANLITILPGNLLDAAASPLNLGVLVDNGGITQTIALLPGSVALNAGNPEFVAPPTFDQRGTGYPRVSAGRIDTGAFEADAADICPIFPATIANSDEAGLIRAIDCANGTATNDVINLASSGIYTLSGINTNSTIPIFGVAGGASGLPHIQSAVTSGTLTLNGNGSTITRGVGAPEFRFIYMLQNSILTLNNTTLSSARTPNYGPGIFNNRGTLNVSGSTFHDNRTTSGTGVALQLGGGIMNLFGTTTVNSSTFTNNLATFGGGMSNSGGTVTVNSSSFIGNTARGDGGGIYTQDGTLTINASHFARNASIYGGGLFARTSIVNVDRIILHNNAANFGGGIYSGEASTTTISTSTLGSNTSVNEAGGIYVNGGTITLSHTTIASNSAGTSGGGIYRLAGTVNFGDTLIAQNIAPAGTDISGTVTSQGYNLIGSTSGATISGTTTGNLINAAAAPLNLGALANNGGPTLTYALLAGSVAINAGDPLFMSPPDFDQRGFGFPRVADGRLDIGAYESSPSASLTIQLTLQGRQTAPNAGWVTTNHIQISPSGGGAAVLTGDFTSNSSGQITLTNIPSGSYNVWIKGTHTLARLHAITLALGANNLTTTVLLEGDANGNNLVNVSDFSLLATAFGKTSVQVGYNALTDFNNDGIVNISDFSLMATNFSKTGDGGVTP